MDLASFLPASLGLGGEFQTRVGGAIERATSENLVSPDWSANMQICDEINRTAEGAGHAAKALKRRLRSDNPKVLQLTLTLCEASVKNCHRTLHEALGTREFLNEVAGLAHVQKWYEVRMQALGLLQEWGIAFGSDRSLAYGEVYARLQAQGVRFPSSDGSAPVFTPPPQASAAARAEPRVTSTQTMEKLEADLQMVSDKITLCRQMLPESPGVDKDDALSEVVGFLEACRPRMVDLVEAGVSGTLGEDMFNKCLEINDALLRTLEAEREGTVIPVESGGGKGKGEDADLLDLDGGSQDLLSGKMSTFSIKGGDDEDNFDELRKTKGGAGAVRDGTGMVTKLGAVPLSSSEPTAAPAEDDLDDFLNSLTEDVGSSATATGTTSGGAGAGAAAGSSADVDDDLDRFLA